MYQKSGFHPDDLIITLLQIKHQLGSFNTDHLVYLSGQGHIKRSNGKLEVTIPLYQDESELYVKLEDLTAEQIQEYRKLFKGVRTGSMGDKFLVQSYLQRFIEEERITFETIIEATKYYIANTTPMYISNADNFIYQMKGGAEVSMLRRVLEEETFQESESLIKFI